MLVNLDDVLKPAQREHYGVGLFNTTDTDMLQAAIEAAESLKTVKSDLEATRVTLTAAMNAFRILAIYLKPVLPLYTRLFQ